MKNLLTLALILFVFCTSCKDDDEVIIPTELPQSAQLFVETHFAPSQITKVVKDKDNSEIHYDVTLDNGIKLSFDKNGTIEDIESLSKLPDTVIPQPLLDYVQTNYAASNILEWEKDRTEQEIKLSNGVELKFNLAGLFLRVDN